MTVASLNLTGSVAFAIAAVASLVEPSSGGQMSARVTNSGTALGGLCFLLAALSLILESAAVESRAPAA